MIGAPKAPAGGFSITSLPRTEAPATQSPETKSTEQTQRSGRRDNPVLRALMADSFEGHGARGRGLGLGHMKRAARAERAEGKSQEALQKLIGDLTKLLEQLLTQLGQKPTTPGNTGIVPPGAVQGSPTPGNTGIVPPGAVQGSPTPGNTGIVPPGAVQGSPTPGNTGIVPPSEI
jgi:hypothetical protein